MLTPTRLDNVALIGLLPSHGTSAPVAAAFDAAGANMNCVARCEFFATALNLALEGVGIALVDPISAANQKSPDLCVRPFAPRILYEVAVLKPARGGLSRLAEAFAEAIDRHVRPFLTESKA